MALNANQFNRTGNGSSQNRMFNPATIALTCLVVTQCFSACEKPQKKLPEPTVTKKKQPAASWEKIVLPEPCRAVTSASNGKPVALGESSIFLSNDNGTTWRKLVVGTTTNRVSKDGGKTFQTDRDRSDEDCRIEAMVLSSGGTAVMVGIGEHATRLTSFEIENQKSAQRTNHWITYSRDPHTEAYGLGRNLVQVGNRLLVDVSTSTGPALLESSNGGKDWKRLWNGTTAKASIAAIDFHDDTRGMMILGDGSFLKTTDGGRSWTGTAELPPELRGKVTAVKFQTETTAVAIGTDGLTAITEDGGNTWRRTASGTTANLLKTVVAPSGTIWAIGERGTVLESNDGGKSWKSHSIGTSTNLTSLSIGNDSAWISTEDGEVFRHITNNQLAEYRSIPLSVALQSNGAAKLPHKKI